MDKLYLFLVACWTLYCLKVFILAWNKSENKIFLKEFPRSPLEHCGFENSTYLKWWLVIRFVGVWLLPITVANFLMRGLLS